MKEAAELNPLADVKAKTQFDPENPDDTAGKENQ